MFGYPVILITEVNGSDALSQTSAITMMRGDATNSATASAAHDHLANLARDAGAPAQCHRLGISVEVSPSSEDALLADQVRVRAFSRCTQRLRDAGDARHPFRSRVRPCACEMRESGASARGCGTVLAELALTHITSQPE